MADTHSMGGDAAGITLPRPGQLFDRSLAAALVSEPCEPKIASIQRLGESIEPVMK
jgi:hypothetical protein